MRALMSGKWVGTISGRGEIRTPAMRRISRPSLRTDCSNAISPPDPRGRRWRTHRTLLPGAALRLAPQVRPLPEWIPGAATLDRVRERGARGEPPGHRKRGRVRLTGQSTCACRSRSRAILISHIRRRPRERLEALLPREPRGRVIGPPPCFRPEPFERLPAGIRSRPNALLGCQHVRIDVGEDSKSLGVGAARRPHPAHISGKPRQLPVIRQSIRERLSDPCLRGSRISRFGGQRHEPRPPPRQQSSSAPDEAPCIAPSQTSCVGVCANAVEKALFSGMVETATFADFLQ